MDSDSDDDALDVARLVDGLLPAALEDQVAQELPEAASEDRDDIAGLVEGLLAVRQPVARPQEAQIAPVADQRNRYGPLEALAGLGDGFQQQLFARFCAAHTGAQAARPTDAVQKIAQHYVAASTMKSAQAVADATGVAKSWVLQTLLHLACCLLHGSCFLAGAMLHAWHALFRAKRWRPVAVISKMRYDETPLRLKLHEYTAFFTGKEPGLPLPGNAEAEAYKYAKIFRIEWTWGRLVS